MKHVLASIVAVAFAVVGFYVGRPANAPPSEAEQDYPSSVTETEPNPTTESATDVVWALLDAAGRGDVEAYAELLTGELQDRFTDTADRERDGAGLLQTLRGVKGIAVMAPQNADTDRCIVEAEFQYADRKEGQRFGLRRDPDAASRWRIETIEPARPLTQTIPYGTPVDAVPARAR
jgi:hypothetical protein